MKAYVLHGQGRAGLEDVTTPLPGPGEVRLRVVATALNHLDVFARGGLCGPGSETTTTRKIVIEPGARGGG
jgi:NADPH:quinone reductase-like Zn-dependent oxidoreductase